jgi:TetR/AcrR family transcriptional regulator, cholesterol catabolism regulator
MNVGTPDKRGKRLKTSLSTDAARRRIVAGARHHFLTHGFRSVTMDDLALELGMSKKTLYVHFPAKTALIEAVLRDRIEETGRNLERITSRDSSDFPATLHALLSCMLRHTEEIRPSFLRDLRRTRPQSFAAVEARRQQLIRRHFGKILDKGRKAGFFRDDIPANVIIEVLLTTVQAIANPQKLEELGLSPQVAFLNIYKIILYGITRTRGGTDDGVLP